MRDIPDEAAAGPQIEDLLIAGLDRYFAGRHEEAIHIWTRVLFIDRGHRRARAYIERARLALAERQREQETLLQDGVAAMGRGDTGAARTLLSRSVRDGGPDDRALAALAQLDRLDHAAPSAPVRTPVAARPRTEARGTGRRTPWMALLIIAGLATIAAVVGFGAPGWWDAARPGGASDRLPAQALPIVTTSEAALVRARTLQARGRLRDAAAALDVIAADDPARREADALLIDIQEALLAAIAR
ncbi:MAG: hypothetical protein WD690_05510 [Vicinamibacterales bacterium]